MSNHVPSTQVDISTLTMPEFVRLAEEVATTQTPRELVRHKKPLAVLMPVGTAVKPQKKRAKTKADYEAFRAAAGSWQDVDTDTLLNHIYEDRRRTNTRTSVKL